MTEMEYLDHVAMGLQGFPGVSTKVTIELTPARYDALAVEVLDEYPTVEFVSLEKRSDQICCDKVIGRYGLLLYGIRFTFIVRG